MEAVRKAKLSLKGQSDEDLRTNAARIKNAMVANAAKFPDSTAAVAALDAALSKFTSAVQDVADGKLEQQARVSAKNAARVELERSLRLLSSHVDNVADGDTGTIHEAGMIATNGRSPLFMAPVGSLRVTPSENEGELIARWQPVPGVRIYEVQVCFDVASPTNWQPKLHSTKATCRLNDTLASGQKVWVRVRAVGSNDNGAWSDPVRKTVP